MKANLHIKINFKNGVTTLGTCYFSPPLKILNITEGKAGLRLHLMLMSSSPGILDKDDYDLKIEICCGSHLQLHTPAYQRLFAMAHGAQQQMNVHVEENASFVYLPHPVVPHRLSLFTAKNNIFLHTGSSLLWGEILTCGRQLKGEIFSMSSCHTITSIFLNDKLIIKENLLIRPAMIHPQGMGQMEGYTHQASLIFYNEKLNIKKLCDEVYDFLSGKKEIAAGTTAVSANAMMVRLMGYKAEQLFGCLKDIQTLLEQVKPAIYAA